MNLFTPHVIRIYLKSPNKFYQFPASKERNREINDFLAKNFEEIDRIEKIP